jgi:hypothetical protein
MKRFLTTYNILLCLALVALIPCLLFFDAFYPKTYVKDFVAKMGMIRPIFLVYDTKNKMPALVNENDLGKMALRTQLEVYLADKAKPSLHRIFPMTLSNNFDLNLKDKDGNLEVAKVADFIGSLSEKLAENKIEAKGFLEAFKNQITPAEKEISLTINNTPARTITYKDISFDLNKLKGYIKNGQVNGIKVNGDQNFKLVTLPNGEAAVILQTLIQGRPSSWKLILYTFRNEIPVVLMAAMNAKVFETKFSNDKLSELTLWHGSKFQTRGFSYWRWNDEGNNFKPMTPAERGTFLSPKDYAYPMIPFVIAPLPLVFMGFLLKKSAKGKKLMRLWVELGLALGFIGGFALTYPFLTVSNLRFLSGPDFYYGIVLSPLFLIMGNFFRLDSIALLFMWWSLKKRHRSLWEEMVDPVI